MSSPVKRYYPEKEELNLEEMYSLLSHVNYINFNKNELLKKKSILGDPE